MCSWTSMCSIPHQPVKQEYGDNEHSVQNSRTGQSLFWNYHSCGCKTVRRLFDIYQFIRADQNPADLIFTFELQQMCFWSIRAHKAFIIYSWITVFVLSSSGSIPYFFPPDLTPCCNQKPARPILLQKVR